MTTVRETWAATHARSDYAKLLTKVRNGKSYCSAISPTGNIDNVGLAASAMTEPAYHGIERKWDDAGLYVTFNVILEDQRTGEFYKIHVADAFAPLAAIA